MTILRRNNQVLLEQANIFSIKVTYILKIINILQELAYENRNPHLKLVENANQ